MLKSRLFWYKLFFMFFVVWLFLLPIDMKGHSFWMDNNGLIDLGGGLFKYFSAWNENILGSVSFTTYSSLAHYILTYISVSLGGLIYGNYISYFVVIFTIYYLGYKITGLFVKDDITTLVVSIAFIFNISLIRFFYGQGTITFMIGIVGFLAMLYFILKVNKNPISANRYYLYIILSSLLVTHPFLFLFFNIILFIFLQFYCKVYFRYVFYLFSAILLVNFFWIFQFIYGGTLNVSTFVSTYSNNIVSVFSLTSSVVKSLLFLGKNADYFGEFFGAFHVRIELIYFIMWGLFLLSFLGKSEKDSKLRLIIFPLLLFLVLFSIGGKKPLGVLYEYMYYKFSFFSAFRTFSNVLPFAFYLLLIGVISNARSYARKFLFILNLIILVFFILSVGFNKFEKSTIIPKNYFDIKDVVDSGFKRGNVLLLPCSTYDYYSWDTRKQDKYFLEAFFNNNGLLFYRPTLSGFNGLNLIFNDVCKGLITDDIVEKYNIQYILFRKDLLFKERQYYDELDLNVFNERSSFKKVVTGEYADLYEVIKDNSLFKRVFNKKNNTTEYKLDLKFNNKSSEIFAFSQSYNPEWKIYPGHPINTGDCSKIEYYSGSQDQPETSLTTSGSVIEHIAKRGESLRSILKGYGYMVDEIYPYNTGLSLYPRVGEQLSIRLPEVTTGSQDVGTGQMTRGPTTECINTGYTFFQGEELSYLRKQPLWDDTHKMIYDYANGREINLQQKVAKSNNKQQEESYLEQGLRQGRITQNPDGSYTVSLTLYFRPQSWFYVGLMISGATLVIVLGLLLRETLKNRRTLIKSDEDIL